jgi:kynureninase
VSVLEIKEEFSRFLGADPERLHFAAHSHHYWPDATREAALRYWDDTCELADDKWGRVLGEVVPEAQGHVARLLVLERPQNVAWGMNTHEFVVRMLSCFPRNRPVKVLTTDGEFHSFQRQMRRLEEERAVEVERVPVEPFDSFEERFAERVAEGQHEFVFFSHVFFDSGFVVQDLEKIVSAAWQDQVVMVDGYHAFMALPVDLSGAPSRAFYTAAGYKYAMSGEGAGFLWVPPGTELRPRNTGWFASFDELKGPQPKRVSYPDDAYRFWGATFPPDGVYRFNAVQAWMQAVGLTVEKIHAHVRSLQEAFLEGLGSVQDPLFSREDIMVPMGLDRVGHFLTVRRDDAAKIHDELRSRNVWTDVRGDRLRFGFGVYQDEGDIERLLQKLSR